MINDMMLVDSQTLKSVERYLTYRSESTPLIVLFNVLMLLNGIQQ